MYAAMNHSKSSSKEDGNVGQSDEIEMNIRQRSRDATRSTRDASNSDSNNDEVGEDDVDHKMHIRRTKSSVGVNSARRQQNIKATTPARRVTSGVTGTTLRHSHSTPIVTRHDDVIGKTPATTGAPDLSGI